MYGYSVIIAHTGDVVNGKYNDFRIKSTLMFILLM